MNDQIFRINGRTIRMHELGGPDMAGILTIVDKDRAAFDPSTEITLRQYLDSTRRMVLSGEVFSREDADLVKSVFPHVEITEQLGGYSYRIYARE